MEGPSDIDYIGIGEGLSAAFRRDSTPSESTIGLSDDWLTPWDTFSFFSYALLISDRSPYKETWEPYSDTSTAKPALDSELEPEPCKGLSPSTIQRAQLVSATNKDYSPPSLTPLERYCYHVQAHEQLAVGQIENHWSFTRLNRLDHSLYAATKLLGGFTPQASASSWSIISSSAGDTNMLPALELENLIRMRDSAEWQAVSQEEQAKHLHKIAKLRRRIKAEGSPRKMKSVRVRKRSKNSNVSNETTGV
ncbi:hypothetical protein F4803DRAFT_553647 [Xylaria telfairii]|nr:hypothetical protein F4803DRAFT_553647 [Xylaria telfairii]